MASVGQNAGKCPSPARSNPHPASRSSGPSRSSTAPGTPAKRTVGETVVVSADVFRDGHEVLRAVVRHRGPGDRRWGASPLHRIDEESGGNRWPASSASTAAASGSSPWRPGATPSPPGATSCAARVDAGQEDLAGELSEGALHLEAAAARSKGADAKALRAAHAVVADDATQWQEKVAVRSRRRSPSRRPLSGHDRQRSRRPVRVDVDPERARFGSWYELFPARGAGCAASPRRSRASPTWASTSSTSADPPDRREEPQGPQQRAGRRQGRPRLTVGDRPPRPRRPRCDPPRAGHDRGLRPPRRRRERARHRHRPGLRDPVQRRPPVLTEHPEWFNHRPDGTLKYAENPPKKYQDIYNVNWTARTGRVSGRRCSTWSCTGATTGCARSASTTRTPSRCRSGSG